MAKISLISFLDMDTGGYHTASSWQAAKDSEFEEVIDESLEDEVNLTSWSTPLPKIPPEEGYYSDLDELYFRVKVHIYDSVSDWFELPVCKQDNSKITVVLIDGSIEILTDTIDIKE